MAKCVQSPQQAAGGESEVCVGGSGVEADGTDQGLVGNQALIDGLQCQADPVTGTGGARRAGEELTTLIDAVSAAETDAARQTAATALATWCRTNLPNADDLQAYLSRSDVTMEDKTATIGQLAVEVARNEFLTGWSYEGGVTNGGSNGWENDGGNRGEFPSYYQDQVLTYGRDTGAEWCTSFVGSSFDQLGFQFNADAPRSTARSIFWSGYRLRKWATDGQSNEDRQLTPDAETVDQGLDGSALVDRGAWAQLTSSVNGAADDAARGAAVDAFFTNHTAPQAGDVLVLGSSSNDFRARGKSHTTMVESYDAATRTISTIEGNAGHAVTSRRLNLADAGDAATIVFIARVGANFFMDDAARAASAGQAPAAETEAPATDDPEVQAEEAAFEDWFAGLVEEGACPPAGQQQQAPISADDLLGYVRDVNTRIATMAQAAGMIQGGPDADTYTWANGTGEGAADISVN